MRSPNKIPRKRTQGGNSLLEFALCSTVLLLMTCGVCDFARLFNIAVMAVGAANAGAQFAAVGPHYWSDYTDIKAAALNDTGNYPGATATATDVCYCGASDGTKTS